MSTLLKLAAGVAAWWGRLARGDRLRMGLVAFTVPVAACIAFDSREAPGDFVMLATDLGEAEVQAVCELLTRRRVPFELQDGGHTLLVPAILRAELTIELPHILSPTRRLPPAVTSRQGEAAPAQVGATSSLRWLPALKPPQKPSAEPEAV